MPKAPKWSKEFVSAVVNGDMTTLERALALGLPVDKWVCDDKTFTPLHYAIDGDAKPAIIAALLDAGSDVNAWTAEASIANETPLMMAADRARLDLVKLLLAAGADVHAVNRAGLTALGCLGWGGKTAQHEHVTRELIARGAKPNAEAVVAAARYGSAKTIQLLVEAGADVNEVSRWGTALHLVADDTKRAEAVAALLAAGANPTFRLPADAKHYAGKSALDVARESKAKRIIAMLEAPAEQRALPALPNATRGAETIAEIWKRLEKALGACAMQIKKSLNRPATAVKLAELERKLGVKLPSDVRESYLLHNGQKAGADGLVPESFANLDDEYCLLSLADIFAEWRPWKELLDMNEFAGRTATPDAGVRSDWWNPAWVSIASNGGGDSLCIDLAPTKGGTPGQIILMSHESGDRPALANSWRELLGKLVDYYQEQNDAD